MSSSSVSSNKRIADLEAQVQQLLELNRANLSQRETSVRQNEQSDDIRLDKMIPVISLLPFELSMKQLSNGKPKYKFSYFGERKLILYQEIIELIEMYRPFMEAGYFYIDNLDVVKRHGLEEIYSKILDKVKIEEIVNCKDTNSVSLYASASERQQGIINEFIIGKIRDSSEDVSKLFDMNFLREISNISGVDVVNKAKEAKQILIDMKNIEEEKSKQLK